jgi:hypothetical protein
LGQFGDGFRRGFRPQASDFRYGRNGEEEEELSADCAEEQIRGTAKKKKLGNRRLRRLAQIKRLRRS